MIDPAEGERAELVYRQFKENREGLKQALLLLQEPLRILDLQRRFFEQNLHEMNLAAADIVGTKLHSKKIGREELLDDLWKFTKPIQPAAPPEPVSDFNPDNELS